MELLTELSNNVKMALASEHQKALKQLVHERTYTYQLPMHPVPMNLLQDPKGNETKIQTILLPDLALYIDLDKIDGDMLSRDAIEYRVATNNASLPVSHIYKSSGWICLGNLFVPSMISKYSPQQPLETLLLYNDRVLAHGNPEIKMTKTQKWNFERYLGRNNIQLTSYEPNINNWVAHDTLWKISHEVWANYPLSQAKAIMRDLFAIVFAKDGGAYLKVSA